MSITLVVVLVVLGLLLASALRTLKEYEQEAASIMEPHPIAVRLRYLQTLAEISSENSSTTIFPIPLDLLTPSLKASAERAD